MNLLEHFSQEEPQKNFANIDANIFAQNKVKRRHFVNTINRSIDKVQYGADVCKGGSWLIGECREGLKTWRFLNLLL